jgi:hypothetical protein
MFRIRVISEFSGTEGAIASVQTKSKDGYIIDGSDPKPVAFPLADTGNLPTAFSIALLNSARTNGETDVGTFYFRVSF